MSRRHPRQQQEPEAPNAAAQEDTAPAPEDNPRFPAPPPRAPPAPKLPTHSDQAALHAASPAKAMRPGRVLCKALRTCVAEGMARYSAEQFTLPEADARKREDRGELEVL